MKNRLLKYRDDLTYPQWMQTHKEDIENLFAGDLRFLEEMYNRINEDEVNIKVRCPECGAKFEKEFGRLGES